MSPLDGDKISTWNRLWPKAFFNDDPSLEYAELHDGRERYDAVGVNSGTYTEKPGKFAHLHNLRLGDYEVIIDGEKRNVAEHQCYAKCAESDCTDEYCNCEGYFSGFDTPTSNAICGDELLCEYLCDNIEECVSIDMHMTLPRCFLNDATAPMHLDELTDDPNYKVLELRTDPNSEHTDRGPPPARKLQSTSLLNVIDHGYSWDQMLRFTDITFKMEAHSNCASVTRSSTADPNVKARRTTPSRSVLFIHRVFLV